MTELNFKTFWDDVRGQLETANTAKSQYRTYTWRNQY